MEKLKSLLVAKGVSASALDKMDNNMISSLAKAFNIDPTPFMPREIKFENGKNGALYVVTNGYAVPKFKNSVPTGETSLSRGVYIRVEAIEDVIKDLQTAMNILKRSK